MAYQVGESIVIRRGDPNLNQQSELRMPRSAVACWADSIRDLYRYRIDTRGTTSFETHLRDARWCLRNDLLDLSIAELQSAKAFRPGSAVVARLEERIEHAISSPNYDAASLKQSHADQHHPGSVATVGHKEPSLASAGISDPLKAEFARSVQVTLINRCGNCHSTTSDRSWKIALPPGKSRASAALTYENLDAILPFIDTDQPLASPLLTKATMYHGGSTYRTEEPPLGNRHARAIDSLKRWLLQMGQQIRQSNSGDHAVAPMSMNRRPLPALATEIAQPAKRAGDAYLAAKQSESAIETSGERGSAGKSHSAGDHGQSAPMRMPKVDNPFDPELFNRQFHR
jgi:hypothetical protein